MLENVITKLKWKTKIVKTLWKVILQCYYWYVTYYASEEATSKHRRDYPFSSSRLTAIWISPPKVCCVHARGTKFLKNIRGTRSAHTIAGITHTTQERLNT